MKNAIASVLTCCLVFASAGCHDGSASARRFDALERRIGELSQRVAAVQKDIDAMRADTKSPTAMNVVGASRSSGGVRITRLSENVNLVEGVVGQGLSAEAAMSDAHRRAVEVGARTYIDSKSSTEDFTLIRDTIYARSQGFIQNVKELRKATHDDGVWSVKISAEVSISGIDDFWGATRALLERLGNPKIMVSITETIAAKAQKDSTLQTRIEGLLIKSGFVLVDKTQLARIMKDMKGRPASQVHRAAKGLGAQLFIVGDATTVPDKPRNVGGVWLYSYEATGNLRCYRSDTGRVVSSQPGRARGVDRNPAVAAKRSLTGLAEAVAPQIQKDILYHWKEVLEKISRDRMTKPK